MSEPSNLVGDPQSRKSTADLVITLFNPEIHSGNEPPASAPQMVFNVVKVTNLTSRINFLLKHILVKNLCDFANVPKRVTLAPKKGNGKTQILFSL